MRLEPTLYKLYDYYVYAWFMQFQAPQKDNSTKNFFQ